MIHLLWATIRPNAFIHTHSFWLNNAENKENIKTYVCVDKQIDADIIQSKVSNINMIISDQPNRIGVCYPCYLLSSNLIGNNDDIVVFASDDFTPPKDWDTYLLNKLKDKDGVLMVFDGYQKPDSSNMLHPVVTVPIMTYSALVKMNMVIYHPSYNHMFSDCELYLTAKDLGLLIDDRMNDLTEFTHHHYANGKRPADAADKGYQTKWKSDEVNWNNRKNLPVEERIKV